MAWAAGDALDVGVGVGVAVGAVGRPVGVSVREWLLADVPVHRLLPVGGSTREGPGSWLETTAAAETDAVAGWL